MKHYYIIVFGYFFRPSFSIMIKDNGVVYLFTFDSFSSAGSSNYYFVVLLLFRLIFKRVYQL